MQKKNLRFLLTLSTVICGLAALSFACGDLEESCDPDDEASWPDGQTCECDDPEDAATCALSGEPTNNGNNVTNNGNNVTNNGNNVTNNGNNDGDSYRFVLIEDLSSDNLNGDTPGADIDGIAIDKDGVEYYASNVEDFSIGGANNGYTDTNELLGAPDSECTKANFTALGGAANDGYVIVSFEEDASVDVGDGIVVYELGPTVCTTQTSWKDDETRVSISIGNDIDGTWEVIGSTGTGENVVYR